MIVLEVTLCVVALLVVVFIIEMLSVTQLTFRSLEHAKAWTPPPRDASWLKRQARAFVPDLSRPAVAALALAAILMLAVVIEAARLGFLFLAAINPDLLPFRGLFGI